MSITDPNSRIGATEQQWRWAAYNFGQDLLPAYLGPRTTPATDRLRELADKQPDSQYPWAKTPSRLSGSGKASGIAQWTSFVATPDDVAQWMLEPDYNILLQTRNTRAIDIDISDAHVAQQLEDVINGTLGVKLPVRYRANSGKRTLLVRIAPVEYIGKRVVHTRLGAIEFLATGQQTVLCGMHPSGTRFDLRGFEDGIPEVSLQAMATLWDTLRAAYDPDSKPLIIAGEKQGAYTARLAGQAKEDLVLAWLEDEGVVTGYETNGTANVTCPNEAQHTSGGGANSTSWLPAGLGGKARGAFRCLHSHCSHITTPVFLEMVGYRDKEIDDNFGGDTLLPNPVAQAAELVEQNYGSEFSAVPRPSAPASGTKSSSDMMVHIAKSLLHVMDLETGPKGHVKKTLGNLIKVLRTGQGVVEARYDELKDETCVRIGGHPNWHAISDNLITSIRNGVELITGVTYEQTEVSRQLSLLADENRYDSAKAHVGRLQWDGVPRIDRFAQDILKAVPSEYGVALGRYLFVALVGRVLEPGCKADIAPVLVSPNQNTGKSSMVESLSPFHEWFGQVDLTKDDDDVYRAIKGKVVIELPELKGLVGRDAQSTKALMTQQVDSWTPKYKEFAVSVPRRAVFVGTSNPKRFLSDPTGNRRWAPIRVAMTALFIDWPKFTESRDQYWAEAKALVEQFDTPAAAVEQYSTALRNLAGPAIADATVLDAWHAAVDGFVRAQNPGTRISMLAIFGHLFNSGLSSMDNARVYRIRNIMTMLKLEEADTDVWIAPAKEFSL
jgi:hypothetical protein